MIWLSFRPTMASQSSPLFLFSLILCLSFSPMVDAQEVRISSIEHSTLEVEMLDISDGLSQGMINAVAQDHNGYIWIATKDGLNRYDGVKIKVYRHNPKDTLSISENYIRHVHVDASGRLWVSTQTKGLNLYNPETDGFIRFRHDPVNPRSIGSDMTHRTFSSPNGDLFVWATDKKQLSVLPAASNSEYSEKAVFEDACNRYQVFSSGNGCWFDTNFSNIGHSKDASGFSPDGTLWIFNGRDSVLGFNEESLAGRAAPVSLAAVNTFVSGRDNIMTCLIFNEYNDQVFLTDGHQNLWRYDPQNEMLRLYVHLSEEYSFSGPVFFDSKQRIWVKANDETFYRIDAERQMLEVLHLSGEWIKGDASAKMIEDSFGNFWVPTGGYGLAKISARKEKFKKIETLRPRDARAHHWPFRTNSPEKWHFFDQETYEKWLNCTNPSFLKWGYPDIHNAESHLTTDRNHRFWFVLTQNLSKSKSDLISFDCDADDFEIHSVFSMNEPTSAHLYLPIFFDRYGILWGAHQSDYGDAILQSYNPKTGREERFPFPVDAGPVHYRFISDWWQDEEDCWWLATIRGLFRFNPETEEWLHFSDEGEAGKVLSGNMALSICPDPAQPEEYIWVGTEGSGLNRIDRNTGEVRHFTSEDGLPNEVIYGILDDHRDNLWLSTNYGLCMFNPQTFKVRNFTESDGLNGNEFNRYQFSKAADGTMYFGGVKGVTAFHPESLYSDSLKSELVFNELRILNKPVEFSLSRNRAEEKWLPRPIEKCTRLVFPHDVGTITLSYALLDYTVPMQNRFRYKMEGQDQEWIEGGTATEATYTNLSPGDYRFRVSGLNSHNRWSGERIMDIRILPPWWATWWFRTLTVLTVVGLLYALYRYRLTQVVRVERMRNRIAQDLHDEIGSTLSSISLYSAVVQKTSNGMPEKSKAVLEKISNSTTEMMESMNDIVWSIKADNDSFLNVVNRMRAFGVNMTESRGIGFVFEVKGDAERLKLDMDQRKNIYLIFKESINNALKYAQAENISVTITFQDHQLRMFVVDNGIGFEVAEALINREVIGGNGLRGMRTRAKEIGGDLDIESTVDKGTKISFFLQL